MLTSSHQGDNKLQIQIQLQHERLKEAIQKDEVFEVAKSIQKKIRELETSLERKGKYNSLLSPHKEMYVFLATSGIIAILLLFITRKLYGKR